MGMHLASLFFPIIIFPLFVYSSETQKISSNQNFVHDLDSAMHRISQLEAVLDATIQKVDAKTIYLKEHEKLIQDAESQIHDLQYASYSVESDLTLVQKKISELEEEIILLWAALRTTNFKLHVIEDKARAAENKLRAKALEVEQMVELGTEQWIQVQHLEQMPILEGKHLSKVHEACNTHWEGTKVSLFVQSYLTQVMSRVKSLWAAVTKYHHQLQGFIKHEMERTDITAAVANKEVVFFMASALIDYLPIVWSLDLSLFLVWFLGDMMNWCISNAHIGFASYCSSGL